MKKYLIVVFVFTTFLYSCESESFVEEEIEEIEEVICDGGTFVGLVNLTTQREVEEFGSLCYTKIDGTLVINDLDETDDKITDLSSLINLTEIYTETYPDSLFASLHFRTSLLRDFQGFNNLERVGRIVIQNNLNLTSLNGLESLTSVVTENDVFLNEIAIIDNILLQNLDGLNNLHTIGGGSNTSRLFIKGNSVLENIDGLESLSIVGSPTSEELESYNIIHIFGNRQLQNINGLSSLTAIYKSISFYFHGDLGSPTIGNNSLTDFCGLQNFLINGVYHNAETATYSYDGFNPTIEEIIAGDCSL